MKKRIAFPIIAICCIIIVGLFYFCWFNPLTTIILVRHAEKGSGQNPPLTDQGHARAGALAHALESAGVQAIFVSEFLRTQQTADSAALHLGLTPEILPAASTDELVDRIKTEHGGQVVLVVGHSDTVPQIIAGLGIAVPPVIPDSEFDNFFIVHRHRFGPVHLTHLRYGAP